MSYFIAPTPTRMMRHFARMAECEQPEHSHRYSLSVDVREQEDAYVLSALVPGLKADDLNIQVLENVVTIEGEFKANDQEYLVSELPHGSFRRSLRLPVPVDGDAAEAAVEDGLLTLRLPKVEAAMPKVIKVMSK